MSNIKINLPETGQPRVVILGAGFAGLSLARKLAKLPMQVVLVDKNNHHQFQPLFYQVAMAGIEPSSISFPLRKIFQKRDNVFIRVVEASGIDREKRQVLTSAGIINYDYLVVAIGADTNYFGNKDLESRTFPLKTIGEALNLRNAVLSDYEKALTVVDYDHRQGFIDIAVVGGGATGVEVAGALAEMKKYIIPKEYMELDKGEIDIYLIQSGDRLLKGMSEKASAKAEKFLKSLGVKVLLNTRVKDFDGTHIRTQDGKEIRCNKVIWAAGIKGNILEGLPDNCYAYGNRLKVDRFNKVLGLESIYALGDIAYMETEKYPDGHPQVAPVAIQQAKALGGNLKRELKGKPLKPFKYNHPGSMATIGRNLAVADLPGMKLSGFFAWLVWGFVHLFSLIGTKNKLFVFINWMWNYLTYDQSLRLIIRPEGKKDKNENK